MDRKKQRIAVASKTYHAPMWRKLRGKGLPVISTWIDEAGEGESASYKDLAERCLREVASADMLILFCKQGDILKGAMIEAGASLASNIPVYCVGESESLSRVFSKHPLWFDVESIDRALKTHGIVGKLVHSHKESIQNNELNKVGKRG